MGALGSEERLELPLPRPEPPGLDEIQEFELARIFHRFVHFRLAVVPVGALLAVAVALVDREPWRVAALAGVVGLVATLAVFELVRLRRAGFHRRHLQLNVVLMNLAQIGVIGASGGLESPVLPVLLPMSLLGATILGLGPAFGALIGQELAAIAFFALGRVYGFLPDLRLSFLGGGGPPGLGSSTLLWWAGCMTAFLVVASGVGLQLRGLVHRTLRRALEAREDELAASAAHARELMALSGEIAHELKNPLATVKGLGALLAADTSGRAAERLGVLRGEVDRMQGILEEFLNFSRPLVPLVLAPVDLGRLAAEVAALHEGMASAAGVQLELEAPEPVRARCDARKVRQILINLVQNALEASPRGAAVLLRARPTPTPRIEVLDRGPGLDPERAEALFDPGVTTRARGSGLGLTIARALARQHGGELSLSPREGGGAIATLTLPGEDAP